MSKAPKSKVDAAPKFAVLGAGPAGIAAARALALAGHTNVTLTERATVTGGNSMSFDVAGVRCDYGSHRFHPAADPSIMQDVQDLLGEDLLLRPRHGRIRLGGRWIHFPLKPLDALLRLPKSFGLSLIGDSVMKPFRKQTGARSFKSVLYGGLGPTISESFYFPYVKKLWGLDPDKLAVKLAERRVSSGSVGRILSKMMRMLPGLRGKTTGRFWYPRQGFGQIAGAMLASATKNGVILRTDTEITAIRRDGNKVTGLRIGNDDTAREETTDLVLSSLPLTTLLRLIDPPAPAEVIAAAREIRFRGMILIYLTLDTDQFTEYDAHYFPELSIPISRMSEPKNYSATQEPRGRTVLCAELPCDPSDQWWDMSDKELGERYVGWLNDLGLPVTAKVLGCETRRLHHAYPVYDLGYEARFDKIDGWLSGLGGLLVFGRQGLFAHDNTHHAFAMANGAVDVIAADGSVDREAWNKHRAEFATHTVED